MNTGAVKKKKLFIFHTEFLFLRGGEKYVYELSKGLGEKYKIFLYVETINSYWQKKFKRLNIPVYCLWKPRHFYWLLLPIAFLINFVALKKAIHSTDTIFATSFPLSLLASFVSKKSIVFCFEPLSVFYDALRIKTGSLKDKCFLSVIKFFYIPLDRLAVKRANILATLNEPVAKAIWHRYHKRPHVFIPNGVDTEIFSPKNKPLFDIKKSQYALIMGHSTDYTVLKGTETLLRAMPYVIKKQPNVLLLISESIPNTQANKRYHKLIASLNIQNNIRFVGCVPESKLPGFYTTCDVFCYCGSTKCVGGSSASLSVLEAQSCGIPVLRTLGNSDEIIPKKTGYYFINEKPVTIANEILHYMNLSKKVVARMKKAARKHVITSFSWKHSVHKLAGLI